MAPLKSISWTAITSDVDEARMCGETSLHGALMFLHVPWTEALTGFSWVSVQRTGLEETDSLPWSERQACLLSGVKAQVP